jgi:hypothetical protein
MAALEERGIPYRNEHQMQDITTEPLTKLIVDYLKCIYGYESPDSWINLSNLLVSLQDESPSSRDSRALNQFIQSQRREVTLNNAEEDRYKLWWKRVLALLSFIGIEVVMSLSPDYESRDRLKEVAKGTRSHIIKLLEVEPDLLEALKRFNDDQAVRILTIHKSKGLEFDSVVMMAIENEIFFGDSDANRCAFFVGVSRAKRRLVLTNVKRRIKPAECTSLWRESRSPQKEYLEYAKQFTSV